MKKTFFLFATVVLLLSSSGCVIKHKKDPKIEYLQVYFAADEAAQNSPQKIKKIFLDFEFGMTPKGVKDHLNALKKAGKIHIDRGGDYYYIFHTEHGDAKMEFEQEFYNDSLYRFKCRFVGGESDLTSNRTLCTLDAFSKFTKAHPDYKSFIVTLEGMEDFEPDYYKIKDNLIVHFDIFIGTMTYTNAPILKQLGQEKKLIQQNTLNDF